MPTYLCDDGNAEIEITADSAEEAAQEYVDGGDWGDRSETSWISVYVQEIDEDGEEVGERESITVTLDAEEPDCVDGQAHDWRSPYSVIGGLKENPGVWGHGGGVIIREVCAHCGRYKITDTWAQNRSTGEQGLTSVSYEDADDASRTWIAGREMEAVEKALNACALVVSYDVREPCGDVKIVAADDCYGENGWLTDNAEHNIGSALPGGWSLDWVAGRDDKSGRKMYIVERK